MRTPTPANIALSIILATVLMQHPSATLAQTSGGAGGNSFGSGGGGGISSGSSAGGTGADGTDGGGGGGGGAGATGGRGGFSVNGPQSTFGGAGGASPGASGGNGKSGAAGVQTGGGGGGGGAHGTVVTTSATNAATVAGGKGGSGGIAGDSFTAGGGGGAGGYGVLVNGSGLIYTNSGTIAAGNGGAGGRGGGIGGGNLGNGGNGGGGGYGVDFTGSGTLANFGTIAGGNGGARGVGTAGGTNGTAGAGGAGILGAALTVINGGTITGGLSGDGVTRANAITFTGGVNVFELQAGSTIIGNAAAFSTADTLRLGGSSNASFDVSLIGTQYLGFGIFQKTGSSTWTLTGSNTAALPWSINAGTLSVNGTMANSTMTVNNGGTLAGIGTVGATTIMAGGRLAPGNSPGTLTIAGNLGFQSGALYLVQVTPSVASSANVTGTVSLAGTVNANFAAGSYLTKQYTILTATGGLGGTTFAGLTNTNLPAGFTDSLSYSGNSVFLNVTATLGAMNTGGLNQNQQNIATALNNFFNSGGTLPPAFVSVFGLTGGSLGSALTQLDGEAATGAERAAFQLTNEFLGLMLDPFVNGRGNVGGGVGYASIINKAPVLQPFEQRWSAWGSAYGGANKTNGDPAVGSNNTSASIFGFAGGMDYHLTPHTIAGFALAGAGTNWGVANALGTGRSDALQVGAYSTTWFGPAYLAGALSFSNHWFTTNRSALGDALTANFIGQSYGARLEGGWRYAVLPAFTVTPYGAVQFQDFHTPAYSESDTSGGGFGLTYAAMNATDVRTELGARFNDPMLLYNRPLILFGRLAWAHDLVNNPALNAGFQALPNGTFTVFGAPIPRDSALTTAGAELFLTPNWTLLAKFEGEFANGSQTYAGSGTLRYTW